MVLTDEVIAAGLENEDGEYDGVPVFTDDGRPVVMVVGYENCAILVLGEKNATPEQDTSSEGKAGCPPSVGGRGVDGSSTPPASVEEEDLGDAVEGGMI